MVGKNKYQEIRAEQSSWLKVLEELRNENVQLKNHLAEIVKGEVSTDLLQKAELFQGLFLNKDVVIALLRHDIAKQISACAVEDLNGATTHVFKEQDKLRGDIAKMQQEFIVMKSDFQNTFESS